MKESRKKVLVIISSITAVIVIVIVIVVLWLYSGRISNAKLRVLKATGLPAGTVGDIKISGSDIVAYQALAPVFQKPAGELLSDSLQLEAIAESRLHVSDAELRQAETALQNDSTYQRAVQAVGANEARETVVKQYVLDYKLRAWYASQTATLEPVLAQRLQTVQSQLERGVAFAEVAKEQSDDQATNVLAGDTGYVNLQDAIPEYRDAVTLLTPNKRTIVYTRYGIHVVELLGEISQDGKRLVNLREIVLRPKNYDAWLVKETQGAPVVWYIE
jgi:hypothetical protein